MPSTSTTKIQDSAVGFVAYGDHNTNNIGSIIVNYIKLEIRIFVLIILSIIISLIVTQVINQNQNGNSQFTIPMDSIQAEINEDEFNLPRLIDTFHGRGEEFNKLDELFFSDKKSKIVVHGLAGYGKTELCKQYAQKCLDEKKVDRVFWINAENEDELKKLSAPLKKINKKYKHVRCLFVFDNALNRQSVYDYEPSNEHKMLITSHVADWGPGVEPIPIKPLSLDPAKDIFKSILEKNYKKEDNALYDDLAELVDCVPIGIQIVGGYVRHRIKRLGKNFQLEQCIEEIKQSKQDIIKKTISKNIANSYKNSIYGALTASLNKIHEDEEEDMELAVIVLYACALLEPEWIEINQLANIPTISELTARINFGTELKSAIGLLVNLSFVSYADSDENFIRIHRLVQLFLREHLYSSSLEDDKYYRTAVYSLICIRHYNYYASSLVGVVDAGIVKEYVEFLKKVFQSPNWNSTSIIYEYHLFYYAVKNWNNKEMLELLLQHADINETNGNGYKVLFNVAITWNVEALDWLIKHDVYVNHRNVVNITIVRLLSIIGNDGTSREKMKISTLAVLLEHDTSIYNYLDMDIYKKNQFWLLSAAAGLNNVELLRALLNKGFDANSSWGLWNYTVLHTAVAGGNVESLKLLINHGANFNALNNLNEPPSFIIVDYRSTDKQKLREILDLLHFNDHSDMTDFLGGSLLHHAAEMAHEALVSVLVETYKCNVNQQDIGGNTPLHSLIRGLKADSNKEEVVGIVRTLIQHGANLTIRTNDGHTLLKCLNNISKLWDFDAEYLIPLLTPTDVDKEH